MVYGIDTGELKREFLEVTPRWKESWHLAKVGRFIVYSAEEEGLYVFNTVSGDRPYKIPISNFGLIDIASTSERLVVRRLSFDVDNQQQLTLETFDIGDKAEKITSFCIDALEGMVTTYGQGRMSAFDAIFGDSDYQPTIALKRLMTLTSYQTMIPIKPR